MIRTAAIAIAAALLTVSCTSGGKSGPPASSSADAIKTSDSTASTSATSASAPTSTPSARAGAPAPAAVAAVDWPTYHGNNQRTGVASSLVPVHTAARRIWSLRLDGAVYGSPVVVNGAKIVVTENDSVYRIAGNRVVWRKHLGTPVPRSSLPCGNIDPTRHHRHTRVRPGYVHAGCRCGIGESDSARCGRAQSGHRRTTVVPQCGRSAQRRRHHPGGHAGAGRAARVAGGACTSRMAGLRATAVRIEAVS